jgi:prephenate dehydratase
MKILYQGNEGAYSQLAAKEIFPDAELISCKTFEECFKKSSNDESLRTIIPIENSIAGRVADIQYLMNKYKLQRSHII